MAIPPMDDQMYIRAHTDSESTLSADENLNVDGKLEEDNDQRPRIRKRECQRTFSPPMLPVGAIVMIYTD